MSTSTVGAAATGAGAAAAGATGSNRAMTMGIGASARKRAETDRLTGSSFLMCDRVRTPMGFFYRDSPLLP
ncbi:hypothetical protein GCM10022200_10730 [Microbacterium awajiense]|uniref:Uncharacterized protein n=1 Tax=Microbacterium awajiense TaxID=415214 RepID=A0ABP7ADK3_9MICO